MTVDSSQSGRLRPPGDTLAGLLASLRQLGVVPGAAKTLAGTASEAAATLRDTILAEEPAFRASGNPDLLPEVGRHVAAQTVSLRRLFAGGAPDDLAFVRELARMLAEQHFPLEAFLHSYRIGHRVLSRWLRDAALAMRPKRADEAISAVADFAIAYTEAISTVATSEYVAHTRRVAEAAGDRKTELLSLLLAGYDESDPRVAQILKRSGYLEQRQTYSVAVVQSVHPAEMASSARAERIVAALADLIAPTSIRLLVGMREQLVVAVLSARRRQSGWTAPQAILTERLLPRLQLLGPAVLVGLSSDHPSTAFVPKAFTEASVALSLAHVGNRVVRFSDLPLRDLLILHGKPHIQATLPAWAGVLRLADDKAGGALVETLQAFAASDMNVQAAARHLRRHPNTITARLNRIKELTGRDGHRYHELGELLLAAACWKS
ncbi:MAG: helix-turn-helix domain-containing protein [Hyphomicrobiaceae bacterium]